MLATLLLAVLVGESTEVDVGFKRGFVCDDPSIVRAWIVTRDQTNWFIVEGVAPGTTLCRVGTEASRPSFLFEVTVQDRS
jgi:hypothetical protein